MKEVISTDAAPAAVGVDGLPKGFAVETEADAAT